MSIAPTPGPSRPGVVLSVPILLALVVGGMAATTNAQVFALLLAPAAEDLGVSVARLGGLRAMEEVVAIVTAVILAPFIDRATRKRLLLAGFALMASAAAIAFASTSFWHLIGYFTLDGVSKILLFSALLALPGDLTTGRQLDRALGFVIGSFALSGFTIVPLVGLIAGASTWREGYVVSVAAAAASMLLVALVVPAMPVSGRVHESPRHHLVLIVRLPGLLAALIGAFLRFTMFGGILTFSGAFLINQHHVGVGRAGLYFSLGSAAFLCASVASGFLLRFVGPRHILVTGGAVTGALALLAFASNAPLIYVGIALIAAAAMMGMLENASTGLLLRLSHGHRGAIMSLNELGAAAGALLGIGLGATSLGLVGFSGIGVGLGLAGLLAATATHIAIAAAQAGGSYEPDASPVDSAPAN